MRPRPLCPKGSDRRGAADPLASQWPLRTKSIFVGAFFSIGGRPTGSGDPYALRRAALGIIRIDRENGYVYSRLSMTA